MQNSVGQQNIQQYQSNVFAVIMLAAQIPTLMEDYRPEQYIYSNIVGMFNCLEYCRKAHVDRILFDHAKTLL